MFGILFNKIASFILGTPQESAPVVNNQYVQAEDGQIYKREIIERWFRDLDSAEQEIVSPCTNAPMGRTLTSTTVDLGALQRAKVDCVSDFMNEEKTDPVQADDDNVYSRAVIETWFRVSQGSPAGLKSPIDGRHISTRLVSITMDEIYRQKRAQTIAAYKAMTSIEDLGGIFMQLDKCSDVLGKTLDGWAIPCVIVFGGEKVGKSSLIERMTMMNIFPRDHRMACTTRMPIIAHLRRGVSTGNPYLEVVLADGKTVVEGTRRYFNLNNGADTVRQMMEEYVPVGMTCEYALSLHVQTPDVPTLDLIDLPGIISNPIPGEPDDIVQTSRAITRKYIQDYRERAIFLAVVPCSRQIRQDVSLGLVSDRELNIEDRTLGVITRCDEFQTRGQIDSTFIRSLIGNGTGGAVQMRIAPYGYVCCINERRPPPTPPAEMAATSMDNFVDYSVEQLFRQGTDEYAAFAKNGMQDLIDTGRATTNALIHRIQSMYYTFLTRDWLPNTLVLLKNAAAESTAECDNLGQPAAHESTQEVSNKVKAAMCKSLADEFCPKTVSLVPVTCIAPFLSSFTADFPSVFPGQVTTGPRTEQNSEMAVTIPSYVNLEQHLDAMRDELINRATLAARGLAQLWDNRLREFFPQNDSPMRYQRFPKTLEHLQSTLKNQLFDPRAEEAVKTMTNIIRRHFHILSDGQAVRMTVSPSGEFVVTINFATLSAQLMRALVSVTSVGISNDFATKTREILDLHWANGIEIECNAPRRRELLQRLEYLQIATAHITETLPKPAGAEEGA